MKKPKPKSKQKPYSEVLKDKKVVKLFEKVQGYINL
mgnify:CR=1 FL=1|jgi:hypothetical protein|tara:strand:+ start:1357 stop:1464 length:108 start_codon:yes stop_codon:yes gene_type:complete